MKKMSFLNSFIRSTAFIKKFYYLTCDGLWSGEGNHESINNKQIVGYVDWFITSREQYGAGHWQLLKTTAVV